MYVQVFYNYIADLLFFQVNFSLVEYLGMAITIGFSLSAAGIKFYKERKLWPPNWNFYSYYLQLFDSNWQGVIYVPS